MNQFRNRKCRWASSREVCEQVALSWVSHAPVGRGGDAQDVYPAGGVLDDESLMVGSAIRETLISGRDTVLDTQKPATQR
jgi:hypothetical protein